MPGKIKYLVVPDWVTSKHDGQRHFINGEDLIHLYQVRRDECAIVSAPKYAEYHKIKNPELIILTPNSTGDYPLFKKMDEDSIPKIRKIRK